ncbi:L,D-peptidoglycan transpeptidase YkuD (ErfK/YbiS/YcfS/YnhG family) [Streptomyces sp. SAI-208]|uniref:L,D-transpeptidase family protein n=1 Tax=unclassified Streptomyces TaxID=2593676 RepID=UPI002473C08C|nr:MULTISPECIES: L,D-transpeptidase family protein [unclassified Streptomyces]MDH6521229.1 L,D-peptidoglycan transpeptidase YkuD (ErfK/YbiS/YcfS/YnhG family) [Streptomyces sp. SAI-090]MDH6572533.1 L,D-peptidoglycan transpeptidase YkuD (ErfK/YbiS/YcfS/YnhG family) [Streptomyces sp. SAI-117]MDH6612228.1 L,D-peptidoglycan transpeptidase YkuD (ErfK/YbiS/YcfS/YnhG family) [Streptomyces sp. SAI-208]MDH6614676.1 L,D-peptidoglycan transpeptidase YkuD (ErfK/YbiS/YcfS/YnhG family) [Streptomyces sp. SAI-1
MITRRTHVTLLAASLLLTGCGGGAVAGTQTAPTPSLAPARATPSPEISVEVAPQQIPGLGPRTRAGIPAGARQAVVVTGRGRDSPLSTVVLYERTEAGWRAGASWPAHNALKGWSDHHLAGDLRSPIGVYTLTDAGGLLKNPGTKLPYDRGVGFTAPGTGFEGEPLAGSFDYVIAINYNRRPGTSPLDWTRPLGAGRGGGIWLHVDHGGPTHGCVSIAEKHMKELLLALDPDLHPVVVMGDAKSLHR